MGSWSGLNNQPSFNADTMLLLTDGTVMCHETSSQNWHKLTPDSNGSYANGTWSDLASLPDNSGIPASAGRTYPGATLFCLGGIARWHGDHGRR